MSSIADALAPLFDHAPPEDLVDYFRQIEGREYSDHLECDVNLLPVENAVERTLEFREFEPRTNILQGIVLDEANISDCHIYLTHSACRGKILFLRHDGDSRIIFDSLNEYLAAAKHAIASGKPLDSCNRPPILLSDDSAANQLIQDLLVGENEFDIEGVIDSLLVSMKLTNLELLKAFARDENFYIAESVGVAIALHPRSDLLAIAEALSDHDHFQAANAGKAAVRAIVAGR